MKWLKGALIFLVLMEWLRPLPFVAPVEYVDIFEWLLLYFSLIAVTHFSFFFKLFLHLVGYMGAIYYLFHQQLLENQSWKEYIGLEWDFNAEVLSQMDYLSTTAFARTVGFIALLLIVVHVVYHAVLKRNQGIWLALTTASYLILLDIATIYDVKWAFIRIVLYSLLLLALLQMKQVEKQWIQASGTKYQRSYWLLTSLVFIVTVTSIAYAVPKPKEAEIETFAFINENGYAEQKVGYQSGDSTLGGPFMDDETVVFTAVTSEKHYWRGESRSIYTGSEWKDAGGPISHIQSGKAFHLKPLLQNMKSDEGDLVTKVKFTNPQFNLLFYGGQIKEIQSLKPDQAILFTSGNHDIQVKYLPDETKHVEEYELKSEIPKINEELLAKSSTKYPADIQGNLQLPLTLPDRVQKLAYELTKDAKDPYAKVLAIQDYLKFNGDYVYEKEEVPYLEKGQDFVDQFLFESKKGYCDHFSTSMVVLLRSIGIPARYVKGFSTGEVMKREDNLYEVIMKNKNAHSWPEVYFAGYGWVPFEPTPGFVQPVKHEVEDQAREQAKPISPVVPQNTKNNLDKLKDKEEDFATGQTSQMKVSTWVYVFLIVLLLLVLFVWKTRKYDIQFWVLHQRSKRAEQTNGVAKVYLSFIRLLGGIYPAREKSETLQEFVNRVTLNMDTKAELRSLTNWYEKYLYGKPSDDAHEWKNNRNILQKLIKYFLS